MISFFLANSLSSLTVRIVKSKVGSTISLTEKAKKSEQFKKTFLSDNKAKIEYLERDDDNFKGKLARLPQRSEIPVEINDQMVVEFYSK